jgi:hypothetical protein
MTVLRCVAVSRIDSPLFKGNLGKWDKCCPSVLGFTLSGLTIQGPRLGQCKHFNRPRVSVTKGRARVLFSRQPNSPARVASQYHHTTIARPHTRKARTIFSQLDRRHVFNDRWLCANTRRTSQRCPFASTLICPLFAIKTAGPRFISSASSQLNHGHSSCIQRCAIRRR